MYLVLIYIFIIFILLIYDKNIEGQMGDNDKNININIKNIGRKIRSSRTGIEHSKNTIKLNVKLSDTIENIKTIINGSWSNIGIPLNHTSIQK